jgi:hypothetical protein
VTVPPIKGEASIVNNSASFAVRVLSEKLKVLYLEGGLTWDFAFLKRQLESDPTLETTFALVSGRKTKLPALVNFISSVPVDLGRSSVVFVGDGAGRYIGGDAWRSLDTFVSSGGGLFIVGADGLKEIPESARRLLPARLVRPETWGPAEYLDCRVTFDGLNHPICDVEEDASSNPNSWRDISPLLGSHVIDSAKPGSTVLFEAGPEGKSFPVIVAGSYGRGRVLLVAASGLWRWGFSLPGAGGSDRLFSGFASNALWWLSETEKDKGPDMKPQSWVFENGEEITFSGRGRVEGTAEGEVEGRARVNGSGAGETWSLRLDVTDKNGKILAPLFTRRTGADSLVVDFGVLAPGTYNYKVSSVGEVGRTAPAGEAGPTISVGEARRTAAAGGVGGSTSAGQARRTAPSGEVAHPISAGSFVVDSNGPEYRNLFPDSRLLTYVSEASGGKSFKPDEVDVLAREIQTFGEKAIVERQVRLWNHPLLFSVFTMFVAIEWWLRRRSGLP